MAKCDMSFGCIAFWSTEAAEVICASFHNRFLFVFLLKVGVKGQLMKDEHAL